SNGTAAGLVSCLGGAGATDMPDSQGGRCGCSGRETCQRLQCTTDTQRAVIQFGVGQLCLPFPPLTSLSSAPWATKCTWLSGASTAAELRAAHSRSSQLPHTTGAERWLAPIAPAGQDTIQPALVAQSCWG